MKKAIIYVIFCVSVVLVACDKEYAFYSDSQPYLNFVYAEDIYGNVTDSVVNYSFAYSESNVDRDTIWLTVKNIGFVPERELRFMVEQINTSEGAQATPGVHYVAFSNPEIEVHCVMEAGNITANVPLVLLRDESLQMEDVYLRLAIVDGKDYRAGVRNQIQKLFVISDQLVKPASWNAYVEAFVFGTYNKVKHQFLIDSLGIAVDEEYISNVLSEDISYWRYLNSLCKDKLNNYNTNPENLNRPLRDENGVEVNFNTTY